MGRLAPVAVLSIGVLCGCSPTCEAQKVQADAIIRAAASAARGDLGCQSDSDCNIVGTLSHCSPGCSVMTSRAGTAGIRAAVDKANAEICREGCFPEAWPCPIVPFTACVGGVCSVFPPAAWDSFSILEGPGRPGSFSTPPSCLSGQDCTLSTLRPDAG